MSARISWLDVKLGIRMLTRSPALTLVGGLGMAVAIAISVGFFTFMQAVIFPVLPLDEGARVVALENRDIDRNDEERRVLHDFVAWREELRTVEQLGAFRTVRRNLITGDGSPELVAVAEMTASGFRVARVPPLLGRPLVDEDERDGAPAVLVIGHDVWQNRFAGDAAVLGRDVRLGVTPHTIVGVMPEGFAFPENHGYWTPLRADPDAYERRAGPELFIFGRLARGASMKDAQAELDAIGRRAAVAYPETHTRLRPMVMPYTHSLSDVQGITFWQVSQMQAMMTLLLLVVALNVAVLVYARTASRHAEIAVRSALGASRGRIVAQLFAEALVLSLGAAAAGLAIAQFGIDLGTRILESELEVGTPFWLSFDVRPGALLFTIGLAVFAAAIIGVLPALQATGRRLHADLRQLGSGPGVRLGRMWTALIVAQIAIAVAALPAAVNMAWEYTREGATRPVFPAEQFMTASLDPEAELAADAPAGQVPATVPFGERLDDIMRRVSAEPAVAGVTYRARLTDRPGRIEVAGVASPTGRGHDVVPAGVHPNFFDVFGLRLLAGRAFEAGDAGGDATAVIVNDAFVRQVLGGAPALGARIRYVDAQEDGVADAPPARWYEIVGVVENTHRNAAAPERVRPEIAHAAAPAMLERASLVVRLRGATPVDFGRRMREIAAAVDPTLRLGVVQSLAESNRQQQVAAQLVTLAVGLVLLSVLLLSAAGVYALMSFTVTQRRREIGIRSALGAHPRQVLRDVFARAARQIGLGVLVGVVAAAAVETLTGGGLVGGRAVVLLPALALLMAAVGLLAALGPARRGLRIQPTEALRAEA